MEYRLEKQIKTLELDKILKLLADHCVNAEARAKALALRPDGSYVACREMLAQTGDAFAISTKCGRPSFDGLSIPEDALRRAAAGGTLSMGELLHIAWAARTVRVLVNYRKAADLSVDALERFFEALMPVKSLEDAILDAILSEDIVADNASPELAAIRRKLRAAQDSVRDRLNSVISSSTYSKYLQEQLVTMREGRYVVPVRADQKNNVPGLVHGVSASGQTLFIEPLAVVEANNEIRLLEGKEVAEIERILQRLSAMCGEHAGSLLQSCRAAVELEVIFAKSELGIAMNAYLPQFGDDGIIDLKRARHPLIDSKKVVPIDLRLGADYDCLVITGPNTGGKTVALKTTGLFCMMAACGLMLPTADGSRVSWFDRILADIGDEQSIEQSLSTFSAHTTNIVSILEQTNDRSLVLFDELGAGTDPAEGAALAISILETVRSRGAKVVATTHYAELKLYAIDTDRVVNASCEFDLKTLRPTYRLLIGVAGSSNAFAISKRLGVSQAIIDRAKELMNSKTVQLDNVMRRLEKERQQLEKQNAEQKALVEAARRDKEAAEKQMREERAEFEKELARQRTENLRLVESVRFESKKLMDSIEALKKADKRDPDALARRAKAEIANRLKTLEDRADPVVEKRVERREQLTRDPVVGERVYLVDMEKMGTVVNPPDRSGNVMVDIGMGKVRVSKTRLRLPDSKELKSERKAEKHAGGISISVTSKADRQVESSVMIRHMDSLAASEVVEKFLDDCVLAGLPSGSIVHGKGTGTLRRMVHEMLRAHPSVKSFRLGQYGEGESGVTIVEFK